MNYVVRHTEVALGTRKDATPMGSRSSDTSLQLSRRTLLKASGGLGLAAAFTTLDWAHMTPAERALAAPGGAVKLDVLFIGAHPDDEAGTLAALGQWREYWGAKAGVITVTRGEGGGNAVGDEEGPPLGLIREAEERTAVGYAGIENVFNLDGVDFYYTASAPLSWEVWGGDAVLNRIVRVVRATRPDVIVTMNPSAVEGNHGNHQQAAMFAVEAYLAAGDPDRFPEHLEEGFEVWRPRRILRSGANGQGGMGPDAVAAGYTPTVASDVVYGAWNGTPSEEHGARWSELLDKARWAYVSQGWAGRPPSSTNPAEIGTAWFTVIHSRSPMADPTSGNEAALRGAVLPIEGGLPLGTLIDVHPARFEAVPGATLSLSVDISAPADTALPAGQITLEVPAGWNADAPVDVPALEAGGQASATLEVRVPAGQATGENVRVTTTYRAGDRSGSTITQLRTAGAVEATIEPLTEIAQFREWTRELGMQHLDALVPELMALGSGRSKPLTIQVRNNSGQAHTGSVRLTLPDGFAATPAEVTFSGLAAGEVATVEFELTNTDSTLPTANRAPDRGAYPVTVHAVTDAGTADRNVVLNLVPTHEVVRAEESPVVDAVWSAEKYPGEAIDISTLWDGSAPDGPEDCSGTAWVTMDDENLYVFVRVVDDIRGTIFPPEYNKRQRLTDSIEIYVDPRGTAPNTAHTLIAGIMPSLGTMTGPPGVGRDRDNHQGEADVTAPGLEVAVVMADTEEDYTGYDVEAKIPFALLPDNVDPENVGFNIVINDSDTQDRSAQTRTGWSTFAGMRADPWRWGLLTLPGLTDAGPAPKEPTLPDTAALSVASPQSILQSARDLVPLGGWSPTRSPVRILRSAPGGAGVTAVVRAPAAGTVRAYLWDGEATIGSLEVEVAQGDTTLEIPLDGSVPAETMVAVSFAVGDRVSAAAAAVGAQDPEPTPDPTQTSSPSPTATTSPTGGGSGSSDGSGAGSGGAGAPSGPLPDTGTSPVGGLLAAGAALVGAGAAFVLGRRHRALSEQGGSDLDA